MQALSTVSPRRLARWFAVTAILTILTAMFAQGYVAESLTMKGDAADIAGRISAHKDLLRAGFAVYMVEMAFNIAMIAFSYELLLPAGRSLSLLSLLLGITGCVIKAFARVFFLAPLFVLGNASLAGAFDAPELHALTALLLRLNNIGAGMALVFFGFSTLLKGVLLLRATFVPKFLGWLSIVGGLSWMTFLYGPLAAKVAPFVMIAGVLSLMIQVFWFLVFGVDERKWKEQAQKTSA